MARDLQVKLPKPPEPKRRLDLRRRRTAGDAAPATKAPDNNASETKTPDAK